MAESPTSETVAAVDLGSNSFHLIVARYVDGHLHIIDKVREHVVLAQGMENDGRIDEDTAKAALECLDRFAQRLRPLPRKQVRAVGTHALRTAKNARSFLAAAVKALEHPIDVLPGNEEARLIYVGVVHDAPATPGKRLVMDIGGGSTECIIGEGFDPLLTDSLHMGCVGFSRRYFAGGTLSKRKFREAVMAAKSEFQPIRARYRALGWESCLGASGTILAVDEVLRVNRWSDGGITRDGLKELRGALKSAEAVEKLALPGLTEERAPVFAGGVAILEAAFESLKIDRMTAVSGALRQGVIYDLLGRIHREDVRDRTIQRFVERYHVDVVHAARVERTALACLRQTAQAWKLDEEAARQYLGWAARLHEIGLSLAYSGYHRHSAYIVEHADMPGFSREDRELLAFLLLNHRRKYRLEALELMPEDRAQLARRLSVLFRLAVCLNRGRVGPGAQSFKLAASNGHLSVTFQSGWHEKHPLTSVDLEGEKQAQKDADVTLTIKEE